MKVLSIIPARGGSKGIPKNNICKLGSKHLVSYSIKNALESKLVNRVIESTEDDHIAKISKHYGAEVPFSRPKKLARDSVPTIDVIKHVLQELYRKEKYIPKGGADGGDGGDGGSIFFVGDENISTLIDFQYKKTFEADSGVDGQSSQKYGRKGKNLFIKVTLAWLIQGRVKVAFTSGVDLANKIYITVGSYVVISGAVFFKTVLKILRNF